eukprot:6179759-Pleurochrysis_carterae.AAC.1
MQLQSVLRMQLQSVLRMQLSCVFGMQLGSCALLRATSCAAVVCCAPGRSLALGRNLRLVVTSPKAGVRRACTLEARVCSWALPRARSLARRGVPVSQRAQQYIHTGGIIRRVGTKFHQKHRSGTPDDRKHWHGSRSKWMQRAKVHNGQTAITTPYHRSLLRQEELRCRRVLRALGTFATFAHAMKVPVKDVEAGEREKTRVRA